MHSEGGASHWNTNALTLPPHTPYPEIPPSLAHVRQDVVGCPLQSKGSEQATLRNQDAVLQNPYL